MLLTCSGIILIPVADNAIKLSGASLPCLCVCLRRNLLPVPFGLPAPPWSAGYPSSLLICLCLVGFLEYIREDGLGGLANCKYQGHGSVCIVLGLRT